MDLLHQIIERAKSDKQRIVLPEASEERTLRAADRALADDIADTVLWIAERPAHVNINRVEIMPVAQASGGLVVKKKA